MEKDWKINKIIKNTLFQRIDIILLIILKNFIYVILL